MRRRPRANRPLRLSPAWIAAPTERRPRPGSPSSSSSSSAVARSRRRRAGASSNASSSKCARSRTPTEALSRRTAPAAMASASTASAGRMPPSSRRGRAMTTSPTTPPRPLGSGQCAEIGSRAATPAAQSAPRNSRATRMPIRASRRVVTSVQPQKASGIMIAIADRPNSCITRSEAMAPGPRSQLWIGAAVAWLRLGSWIDQVIKAMPMAISPTSSAAPHASAKRREKNTRTDSGMWSKAEALVVVRICPCPGRRRTAGPPPAKPRRARLMSV